MPAASAGMPARWTSWPGPTAPTSSCGTSSQPEIEKTQQVILHVADELGGLPVLGGNAAELLAETDRVIDRLVQDIDRAQHHVHLLFYIFAADEVGGRVAAALVRARAARRPLPPPRRRGRLAAGSSARWPRN